jgi:hypothetical protein
MGDAPQSRYDRPAGLTGRTAADVIAETMTGLDVDVLAVPP